MSEQRPPRLRPVPPETADHAMSPTGPTADAELLDRLGTALAALPPAERRAAVLAFGFDEGSDGVAAAFDISTEDADALTRNALQLLRGAMADADVDEGELFARLTSGRRTAGPAD
jgi:DNA-directed RNA polymerase specialized sigma24 family protein